MGIVEIVSSIIKIILLWFNIKVEKDKELKTKKQEIMKEVNDGFAKDDISAINSAIGKLNRMRK